MGGKPSRLHITDDVRCHINRSFKYAMLQLEKELSSYVSLAYCEDISRDDISIIKSGVLVVGDAQGKIGYVGWFESVHSLNTQLQKVNKKMQPIAIAIFNSKGEAKSIARVVVHSNTVRCMESDTISWR